MSKDKSFNNIDYMSSKLEDLEKINIIWDKEDNSEELLNDTPCVIYPVGNKLANGKTLYQVYLKTSLKNNNTFRLPIPLQDSLEKALLESYNFLSEILVTIEDHLDEIQEK